MLEHPVENAGILATGIAQSTWARNSLRFHRLTMAFRKSELYRSLWKIAAILSAMDAEIAALEAKLAKVRELKQGMMQELLTGRIRLV